MTQSRDLPGQTGIEVGSYGLSGDHLCWCHVLKRHIRHKDSVQRCRAVEEVVGLIAQRAFINLSFL